MTEEIPDDIKGDVQTSPTKYDVRVQAKAYELFLQSSYDATDIAIHLGIPKSVVGAWAHKGKWQDRKDEISLVLFESAESKYRDWLIEHKLPTADRHLRISEKLEKQLESILDDLEAGKPVTKGLDMSLKRIADSLSASSAVGARTVGIKDDPAPSQRQLPPGSTGPTFVFNVTPEVPPDRAPVPPKTINVPTEPKDE